MNFKRLFMMLALPLVLLSFRALAQEKIVTGRVTDSKDGRPLASVSVLVKDTKIGTQTSNDGTFSLKVPSSATILVVSSVGYALQEVSIGTGTINVALVQTTGAALNEVIVVGYGTARKKDLTGSVSSVNSKDFQKGSITTPEQLISGKVSGVVITSNSGAPGAGSTIRIRGGSSLNASNDPLIVIDGVPLSNNAISGAPNALSLINPNDIENITVLKDASATAIYGNRASNGVIIITTKKGLGGGKLNVNFSTVNSIGIKVNEIGVLNGNQVRSIVDSIGTDAQKVLLGTANTNWQDQIYQSAFTTDNNISISGGIKHLPYRFSYGYLNQDGILKTSNLQRNSIGINLSPTLLSNHLHIDANLKGSITNNRFADEGAIGEATRMDPTQPVHADNKFGGYFEWLDPNTGNPITLATRNPLAHLELRNSKSTVKRSIGNIQLDYKFHFLPELRANLNAGYDASEGNGNILVPDYAALTYNQGGLRSHYSQYQRNEVFDFYFNYAKDIKSISSRIDATAGYEYQDFYLSTPAFPSLNANGDTLPGIGQPVKTQHTLVSFYGRIIYNFKDRYLLTATIRRDGSSRFNPDNRWGNFPSAAFAWRIKQESFLRNSRFFSEMKLRLGYGVTGQQDIGNDYPYLPRYILSSNVGQYPFGDQSYFTYRPEAFDVNIKWETTTTYNAGIDYGFANGLVYGSIDVYLRKTKDLLNDITAAAGSNLSNHVITNVGSLENKGIEFTVNSTPVKSKNFDWSFGFNLTYNKNKITKLTKVVDTTSPGVQVGSIGGGTGNKIQILTVGYPAYTFYVYKQVYDQNGRPIEGVYADVNKNPGNLFYRYKAPDPKVSLGFTSQFNYKNWNLSFLVRGDFGNYMYNNIKSGNANYLPLFNPLGFIGNAISDVLNTNFQNPQYFSDYYVENASFLRMDNISLGYNFGKIMHNKVNLRVTGFVQNVFVITNYTGLDPEIYGGIDNNIYPRPRIYSLGINIDY